MNEKTITVKDAVSEENAVIVVRSVNQNVGVCLSLENNGDVELFLKAGDLRELIAILKEFESRE